MKGLFWVSATALCTLLVSLSAASATEYNGEGYVDNLALDTSGSAAFLESGITGEDDSCTHLRFTVGTNNITEEKLRSLEGVLIHAVLEQKRVTFSYSSKSVASGKTICHATRVSIR